MRFCRDIAGESARFHNDYRMLMLNLAVPEKAAIVAPGMAPAQIMGNMLRRASEISVLRRTTGIDGSRQRQLA
jgi:hypothetical protein